MKAEVIIKEAASVSNIDADLATLVTAPTVKAAATIKEYSQDFGDLSLPALILELTQQVDALTSGDLARAEAILAAQAHTLDALFNNLANAAAKTNRIDHMDNYLRLAFKAQAQCRTTLEALCAIKSPQNVAFIKQANIGNAVQVNNGTTFSRRVDNREKDAMPGKQTIGNYNDTGLVGGATGSSGRFDSKLEAVEKLDRSSDRGGKGKGCI